MHYGIQINGCGLMGWNKIVNEFNLIAARLSAKYFVLLATLAFSEIGLAAFETPVRLNQPLAMYGEVFEAKFSPDGETVVYRASQDTVGVNELYSVSVDGGISTKLNPPLIQGGDVNPGFVISNDGQHVVYLADQETIGMTELYVVPISGGPATKLNQPTLTNLGVREFKVSSDSSRVVYLADQDSTSKIELYSVPIAGGAATKLNGNLVTAGDVYDFEISSDSSRVAYRADQDTDEIIELYSSPIAGGGAIKLNTPITVGQSVYIDYRFSPDGSRVVYRAALPEELFSVPSAGGTVVRLNGPLNSAGSVTNFGISADSARVVYRARVTGARFLLYSAAIEGGNNIELVPDLFSDVDEFVIDSASEKVAFYWRNRLYIVPLLGGSTPQFLGVAPGVFSQNRALLFSADGNRIVFEGKVDGEFRVFMVPADGAAEPIRLSGDLDDDFDRSLKKITPDSQTVVFRATSGALIQKDIYSVPIAGGTAEQINNPPAVAGADVRTFSVSADGTKLIYIHEAGAMQQAELFSVSKEIPIPPGPPPVDDGSFCFPITDLNSKVFLICL